MITVWAPEIAYKLYDQKAHTVAGTYDTFDIENFYSFCHMGEAVSDNKDHRYPFCNLVRSEALDKLIIGFWIKHHTEWEVMENDFKVRIGIKK